MFFRGGHFTASDGLRKVIIRRPREQLSSLEQNPGSIGMFGSDVFVEEDERTQELFTFQPVCRIPGTFYVGSAERFTDQAVEKIELGEELVIATSYPRRLLSAAEALGLAIGKIIEFSGGVEGAQEDRDDIDVIFELKETGSSIRDNRIDVIADGIGSLDLGAIWRRSE